MEIEVTDDVYEPGEDTHLLCEHVKTLDLTGKNVLDMACGAGMVAIVAAKQGGSVMACDKNIRAVRQTALNAKKNGVEVRALRSDLFESIPGDFDVIVCNPPYLPEDIRDPKHDGIQLALTGGKEGWEWSEQFLWQAQSRLRANGDIYFIFSSLSCPDKLKDIAESYGYVVKEITTSHHFFEEVYLWHIRRSDFLEKLYALHVRDVKYLDHGKRGSVYVGRYGNTRVAIKEKYARSAVDTIGKEAAFLQKVNALGIGPRFYAYEQGVLIRQFIDGQRFTEYLARADVNITEARRVLAEIFRQCRVLDEAGIEKQEMTNPYKHVLVQEDGDIFMIDFERCRYVDRPGNVTQFVQWVTQNAALLENMGIAVDVDELRSLAQRYKEDLDEGVYVGILQMLGVVVDTDSE